MIQVRRLSFARADIVRRVGEKRAGCGWCGGARRRGNLFQYGVERDGLLPNRTNWLKGDFCSFGCACSYHEGLKEAT